MKENILEPGKAYTLTGKYFDDKYGIGAKAYIEDTTEKVLGKNWIEKNIPVVAVFIQRYIQYDLSPLNTYYAKVTRFDEAYGGLGEIITFEDTLNYKHMGADDADFYKWLDAEGKKIKEHNSINNNNKDK